MKKTVLFLAAAVALSGCVTTKTFQKQQAQTAAETKRADDLATQLKALLAQKDSDDKAIVDLQSQLKNTQDQLKTAQDGLKTTQDQLKATQDQLTSVSESNDELRKSLDSTKGQLQKQVADLSQQKDDLANKLADTSKDRDDLAQKLAAAQAGNAALEKAKADLEQAKAAELDQQKKNYDSLTAQLQTEISAGAVTITQLKGKLTVNMVDRILFDSGSAEVKSDGRKVLDQVAKALNSMTDKDIRIEGHTDNVPINAALREKYPSNWELSTARATSVARYLQDHAGVDPQRLVAAGFGEYRPIASNDTPEGRAQNRRIEIVLIAKE